MEQSLFRKKSLERISSPEQLNDYLRVTNPSVWIVLAAVIVLLAGVLVWSSAAEIGSYVTGTAEVKNGSMLIRFDDQSLAHNVEPGMDVVVGSVHSSVTNVGHDSSGLYFAEAQTSLSDGFYSARLAYKRTQVIRLLFN